MKRSMKKAALIAATGALLVGTAFTARAELKENGQWCVEDQNGSQGYWFKLTEDGKVFLDNTWYYIKDSDGVIRCYHFGQNGWLDRSTVIDGSEVNDQGQYVENGVVKTYGENEVQYAAHTDLSAAKAVETQAAATTAASTAAPTATTQAKATTTGKKAKAYKSSGKGDNPASATFTQAYENSSIAGSTVTNNWANFTMNLGGPVPKSDDSGSGTDFYIDTEDTAGLSVSYMSIEPYGSLDAFVNNYLASARGLRGGSRSGDVQLGAYSFKQLTRAHSTPENTTYYDYAYIRQVEGTNYAQVILVEQNGFSENYLGALNTIARVR